ncbi:MAG: hypothetical protein ACI8QT_002068 [Halioglobus sp.]
MQFPGIKKRRPRLRLKGPPRSIYLVDIFPSIVNVELARWSDQALILYDSFQLARFVIHDYDGRLLVFAAPHRTELGIIDVRTATSAMTVLMIFPE